MEIYLLRHAIAEDRKPHGSDAARELTAEGREKLRRVLERARKAEVQPSLILTSPLVRAVQTASMAAAALGCDTVVKTPALEPDSSPQLVWEQIRERRNERAVLLAGHEPLLSAAVAWMLGASSLAVDMKKSALVRLDCARIDAAPKGVLKWMLTPGVS